MINKNQLYQFFTDINFDQWKAEIYQNSCKAFFDDTHGDLKKWKSILERLPNINPSLVNLKSSTLQIGNPQDTGFNIQDNLQSLLKELHPWRKGPFNLFGIFIDTEWRSDLKWDRLKDHISPLNDRIVLDVGCGSGYHAFRMIGDGSKKIVGLEPYLLSVIQFLAINHYIKNHSVQILPLSIEKFQYASQAFDTVFSMGILYHRRSPFDHLLELRSHLRSGGELVLETLVIDGKLGEILVPEDRYAKMRNVWFIPSCSTLESWLKRSKFKNIKLIDVSKTTSKEQRSTEWMRYDSLKNFLDPNNSDKTIEGLPAPRRAIFIAEAP